MADSNEEKAKRARAALDRLDALRERMAREHPSPSDPPEAVTLIRQDRSRDDAGFDPETIRPPRRPGRRRQ